MVGEGSVRVLPVRAPGRVVELLTTIGRRSIRSIRQDLPDLARRRCMRVCYETKPQVRHLTKGLNDMGPA